MTLTKLRGEEELLGLLADAMPGLVAYVDADWRYRFLNVRFRDWFGIDPAEGLGKSVVDILGQEQFGRIREDFAKGLAGETHMYETSVPFQFGGERMVRAFLIPDKGDDGQVAGMFSLTLDITHEIETRERLRLAHQEAIEATQAKSRFLAAASHDLRQPLHALSLFTRALSRRVENQEARELVTHMETALRSLQDMFNAMPLPLFAVPWKTIRFQYQCVSRLPTWENGCALDPDFL